MPGLRCKGCGSERHVKSGQVRGMQRHLCRGCGLHFTDTPPRRKPEGMRAQAVLMYARGGRKRA